MKLTLKPDSKGRITLGKIAKGVSSFHLIIENERIILEPYIEVPYKEGWLHSNKNALASLRRGIEDSAQGRVSFKEDFSKYLID